MTSPAADGAPTPRDTDVSEDDLVTVSIDAEKCIGSGTCEMFEEATFVIPDDGVVAEIVGAGELPRDRAVSIIDRCPSGAISFVAPG